VIGSGDASGYAEKTLISVILEVNVVSGKFKFKTNQAQIKV
jgi:hypothetical protein